jgi:hypothetical protein
LEELKIKVRPKIIIVNRGLSDLTSIFKDFNDKNQEDGKPVLTKTVDFYLDGLKFETGKVLDGLEDEIAGAKR